MFSLGVFMFFPLCMIFTGLWCFCSQRKHLLVTLIVLELIGLGLFYLLVSFMFLFSSEVYFGLVYLIFVVSEGALGLSILVSLVRTHGSNYFRSFSVLLC